VQTANAWQSLMISPAWGAFNNIHGESRNTRRWFTICGSGICCVFFYGITLSPEHTDPLFLWEQVSVTPRLHGGVRSVSTLASPRANLGFTNAWPVLVNLRV